MNGSYNCSKWYLTFKIYKVIQILRKCTKLDDMELYSVPSSNDRFLKLSEQII